MAGGWGRCGLARGENEGSFELEPDVTAQRMTAWQCIGCGRLEGAQPCIGICQDRRMDFVYAAEYDAALAELAALRRHADALAGLVRQLARITPRQGEAERTYLAMQSRAQSLLAALADDVPASASTAPG
jgi:hypothetical protein